MALASRGFRDISEVGFGISRAKLIQNSCEN